MTTLRYVDELFAAFPDNTQGLITPVNMRDFVASFANGAGFVETTTDINVPITDGVPTIVNPLLVGVSSSETFWGVDGNNFLFPNYAAVVPGLIIPTGYTKLARIDAVLGITKLGGGTDNYEIQMTRNGATFGVARDVIFTGAGTRSIEVFEFTLQEIDVSDTYGCAITGIGTGNDVTLESFASAVTDSILVTAP